MKVCCKREIWSNLVGREGERRLVVRFAVYLCLQSWERSRKILTFLFPKIKSVKCPFLSCINHGAFVKSIRGNYIPALVKPQIVVTSMYPQFSLILDYLKTSHWRWFIPLLADTTAKPIESPLLTIPVSIFLRILKATLYYGWC